MCLKNCIFFSPGHDGGNILYFFSHDFKLNLTTTKKTCPENLTTSPGLFYYGAVPYDVFTCSWQVNLDPVCSSVDYPVQILSLFFFSLLWLVEISPRQWWSGEVGPNRRDSLLKHKVLNHSFPLPSFHLYTSTRPYSPFPLAPGHYYMHLRWEIAFRF